MNDLTGISNQSVLERKSQLNYTKVKTEELPPEFFQELIELEMKIADNHDKVKVMELVCLLKRAVEYYESQNDVIRAEDYMNKLKDLMCNKQTVRVFKADKHDYLKTKENKKDSTRENSIIAAALESQYENTESTNFSTCLNGVDMMSTMATTKDSWISPINNNNHSYNYNYKSVNIPRRVSLTPIHLYRLSSTPNMIETKTRIKDDLSKHYDNIAKAEERISEQVDQQSSQFRENLIKTLWMKKSRTSFCVQPQSPIRRKPSIMVTDYPLSPKKKSVIGIQTPVASAKKQFIKHTKKGLSDILEEYTNKIIYNFKQITEDSTQRTINLLGQQFVEKLEITLNYDDQIKELQLMSEDDPDNPYWTSLNVLIDDLLTEKSKELAEKEREKDEKIGSIVNTNRGYKLSKNQVIRGMNKELIKEVSNLLL